MTRPFRAGADGGKGLSVVALLRLLVALVVLSFARGALAGPTPPATTREAITGDRATPRRAIDLFLHATRAGDYERAATCLDLRGLPDARRRADGPGLARDLGVVLERKLWVDLARVPDEPEGDPGGGAGTELLGTISLDEEVVPIALTRVRLESGQSVWLLGKATVAQIPALRAAYGESFLGDRMPPGLQRPRVFQLAPWQWLGLAIAVFLGFVVGNLVGGLITRVLDRVAHRSRAAWDDAVTHTSRGPMRWVIAVATMKALVEPLLLSAPAQLVVDRITTSLLIVTVAWTVVRLIHSGADVLAARLPDDTARELEQRGYRTQLLVTRRIVSLLVGVVACAALLTQFAIVRSVGMSLLASAGLAGIVFGFAAQKSLGGVIAGIQISLTQPIRIGDLVVIEQETGTIEEINLTYVIVRCWDDRRLVVPIARFLETTFQNWTKMGNALIGTVLVPVDFMVPIAAVREEVERLCRANRLWDGRLATLIVTDVTDRAVVLRAAVSVSRADDLADLRAAVREGLVTYLQNLEGGRFLPRAREEAVHPPP